MKQRKDIIVFVATIADRYLDHIQAYAAKHDKTYRIMLLRDTKMKLPSELPPVDLLVECDFSKPHKIAEALLPYQDELLAITCRTEQNIARFAEIIPHVPYLRTPSSESLQWATDKYDMRRRLKLFDAKNTPVFTKVKNNTAAERKRVIEKVTFPMIVKPANLAGSLFVTICYHEDELEQALRTIFRKLRNAYKKDARREEPTIIAEQYFEGEQYSIDSYVNARGEVYHCPLVHQKTARQIGHDDLYTYSQMTPSNLKTATIEKAQQVAETAIHALGLRSVTAHVELMKLDDEWKVIEVAPRAGGARDTLYRLSCDINHTMNDIAIRIPRKPVIPKKCKGYTVYIKYFADTEGSITEMKGIKKIEALESFHHIAVNKKVGDRAVFARNGGRSIFNLYLYNQDRSKLLADMRRLEKMVEVKVESSAAKRKRTIAENGTKEDTAPAKKAPRKTATKKTTTKKT